MKPKIAFSIAACTSLFAIALYVLAFGSAIFCCAPGRTGEGFWHTEKFFYGLVPIAISAAMFLFALRFWARSFARRRNAWLVGLFVGILVVFVDCALWLKFRGHIDDEIQLNWRAESGTFDWGRGEVTLPAGFTYKRDHGMDTIMGSFTSQDGKLVIEYDIGELAGEHGGMGRAETLSQGSRVRVGLRIRSANKEDLTFFSKVSFPDNGCANFYLISPNEEDADKIEFIAQSFRPRARTPSWMRPLLPEIFRSDCRYRFLSPW